MRVRLQFVLPLLLGAFVVGCSSNNGTKNAGASATQAVPRATVAASSSAATAAAGGQAPAPGTGQTVDGVPCEANEALTYHVHAHLSIIANGQPVAVPANIGIPGRCIYWLHTHDTTGVIHVEAPSPRGFTLGNFFDIWGQPLGANQVLGFKADATHSLEYFVNDQQYSGDPREIPLGVHTLVTIEFGPPFSQPPPYTFPAGL